MHTDDPGAALRAGTALGVDRAGRDREHAPARRAQREERLCAAGPGRARGRAVVAVVAGEGNRRLFESMGATGIVDGGETMNPSTEELLDAIERRTRREAVVLANNDNVVLAARAGGAPGATMPVHVVPSSSIQAGLGRDARLRPDARRRRRTRRRWRSRGRASRRAPSPSPRERVSVDGLQVERGAYLGLAGRRAGRRRARASTTVAASVVERLLGEPRDVLTLITGEDEPPLGPLLARVAERHPDLELEVHPGGQPHYPLLISAE